MSAAGAAIAAMAAGDVAFAGHAVAGTEAAHFAADLDDLAGEFMAHGHRHRDGLLRPRIPVVKMDVRAANGGAVPLDQYIVVPHGGFGNILHPDAGFRACFDQSFHVVPLMNDAEFARRAPERGNYLIELFET